MIFLPQEYPPAHAHLPQATQARRAAEEQAAFGHAVRDGLRRREWRCAGTRRADMGGIQLGVDRGKTVALMERSLGYGWLVDDTGAPLKFLSAYEVGVLRNILAGNVYCFAERASRMSSAGKDGLISPCCPHCALNGRNIPETRYHVFWECDAPHRQQIRDEYDFLPIHET